MWQRYRSSLGIYNTFIILLFTAVDASNDGIEGCVDNSQMNSCFRDLECNEYYNFEDFQGLSQFESNCETKIYSPNIGYMVPINMMYVSKYHLNAVPEIRGSYYYINDFLNTIVSLDISNNEYIQFPPLNQMNILKRFNISHNYLTTAKLSSTHNFQYLEEIDLSHNLINKFEIDDSEFIFSNLQKINMSHNKLNEVNEAIFYRFANLQYLDMSNNLISNINPLSFEGTKNLVYLNLAHNKINDLDGSLFRFSKLTYLDLNHNMMQRILFKDFEKLGQLKEINFSHNAIVLIEENVFNNMPLLTNVYFNNNELNKLYSKMFMNNKYLNIIDLSFNQVQTLPKLLFEGKNVSYFDIQGNNLGGALVNGTFQGLMLVSELDLSHQSINSIEDYAFTGIENLNEIFLNHNQISVLKPNAFHNMQNLKTLDLSHNQITELTSALRHLNSIERLSLSNNFIPFIKRENFNKLSTLEYLDISRNNISLIEPRSFDGLIELISFDITINPLCNALESNTFDGLSTLAALDISWTSLTSVQNSSFNRMFNLQNLNISYGKVNDIGFNAFINTGNIILLDLSHNLLKYLELNTTSLSSLHTIYLQNNLITHIASNIFSNMIMVSIIDLSFNKIKQLNDQTFLNCTELTYFDISYNKEIKFNVSFIENMPRLQKLFISGIPQNINFNNMPHSYLQELYMANSSISNASSLGINHFNNIGVYILSNNNIRNLSVGAFSNLSRLTLLDLSFNKLQFIQPGIFKDNSALNVLNISHNHLAALGYGLFRGLTSIQTLDLSYNEIRELQSERFYDIQALQVLIIDFNKISKINFEEFSGIYLNSLSIGGNPLPCDVLVKLKRTMGPTITAIKLHEIADNVNGISCHGQNIRKWPEHKNKSTENDDVLYDIRDILLTLSAKKSNEIPKDSNTENNFNRQIEESINEQSQKMDKNIKNSEDLIQGNNITNAFLERILKMMVAISAQAASKQVTIVKENATYENILPYIAKVKQDLENSFTVEKEKIISDFDDKIALLNKKLENAPLKPEGKSRISEISTNPFLFTDVCVGLILLLLLCFFTFKIYKSTFRSRRATFSTQHIADAMDNSNL